MTYVLFFVIGLSGGAAQFASKEQCEAAGQAMKENFKGGDGITAVAMPRITYFCIGSGFRVP